MQVKDIIITLLLIQWCADHLEIQQFFPFRKPQWKTILRKETVFENIFGLRAKPVNKVCFSLEN